MREFIDSYNKYGFVTVEKLINKDDLKNILNIFDEIISIRRAHNLKLYISHLMPHTWDKKVLNIAKLNNIVKSVEILLQGKIDLIHSQLTFKPPGKKGFSKHQDNYYNRPEDDKSITAVWIAIDDADKKNGSLIVYPFSHNEGLLKVKFNWIKVFKKTFKLFFSLLINLCSSKNKEYLSRSSNVIEQFTRINIPKGYKAFTINAKAGSITFMHGNLIHSSGENVSETSFRRNLLFNYIRNGTNFKPGIFAKRKAKNIY